MTTGTPETTHAPHAAIDWRHDLDAALREARTSGKPLLIDFFSPT